MKVLLFTHKNDIDGMGNAILAKLAYKNVDYELCGTFDLTSSTAKLISSLTLMPVAYNSSSIALSRQPLLSVSLG